MEFTMYDMNEVKELLKEYGVPKRLTAFGKQVTWEKEDVPEGKKPLDNFMEFLESWYCTGISSTGEWGKHATWSLFNTGLGLATVVWNYNEQIGEE